MKLCVHAIVSNLLLIVAALAIGVVTISDASAAAVAHRELGQPDFEKNAPNRLDASGLSEPEPIAPGPIVSPAPYFPDVAIDTSVTPNRIYVPETAPANLCGGTQAHAPKGSSFQRRI